MAQGDKTLKGTFWIEGMRIRLQAPVTNVGTGALPPAIPAYSEVTTHGDSSFRQRFLKRRKLVNAQTDSRSTVSWNPHSCETEQCPLTNTFCCSTNKCLMTLENS